jgi:hypothetical protein
VTATAAFFAADDGDGFVPRPEARSPWSAEMLHGRLLAGLAARTVEAHHGDDGFRPTRLTVDLFRSPTMEPVEVAHHRLRDGGRVRVVECDLHVGGRHAARTTTVLLRTGEQPPGRVWNRPDWDVPPPDAVAAPAGPSVSSMEIRAIGGRGMGSPDQRQVWLRDSRPLVDGEALSPFVRAALASDLASPLGNSSDEGLAFINADITLYLGRMPSGEWIGLEVGAHISSDGIAVSRSDLFDLDGPFGFTDVGAVANTPMARTPPPPES